MPSASSVTPPFQAPFRVVRPSGGDDYAAAQRALTACCADGKELIFTGNIKLSAGLVATGSPGCTIRGTAGKWGTSLEPYNSGADAIELLRIEYTSGPSGSYTVRDLHFRGRNAGAVPMTGGAGIVAHRSWSVQIDNVCFSSMYDCIKSTGGPTNGTQILNIVHSTFMSFVRYGVHFAGSCENRMTDCCLAASAYGASTQVGVFIESRDATFLSGVDITGFYTGVKIKPPALSNPPTGGLWFDRVLCDNGYNGWEIDASSAGGPLGMIFMNECYGAYNLGRGMVISSSANLDSLRVNGGVFQSNSLGGVQVNGGTDIAFRGTCINGNGSGGVGYGLDIASGVTDMMIQDCRFIDSALGYGVKAIQNYGINFGGSHSNMLITGNDFRGNVTGAWNGSPASATTKIANNQGINPKGVLGPPSVPASTVAYTNAYGYDCTVYVAGGTVTAIAVGGTATGMTSGMFRVPAGQTITLTYSSAPTWTWFGD